MQKSYTELTDRRETEAAGVWYDDSGARYWAEDYYSGGGVDILPVYDDYEIIGFSIR